MKFHSLSILILFISGVAQAGTYGLNFSLEVDGAKPVKGKIVVEEGESASISSDDLLIELIPTKQDEGVVKIVADIWQGTGYDHKKHLGTSTLITKLNNSAKITETNENGHLSLTVVPKDETLGSQAYPLQDSAAPMQVYGKPALTR